MSEKTFMSVETVDNGKIRLNEGWERRKQAEGGGINRVKKGRVFSCLFRHNFVVFVLFCKISLKLGIDDPYCFSLVIQIYVVHVIMYFGVFPQPQLHKLSLPVVWKSSLNIVEL